MDVKTSKPLSAFGFLTVLEDPTHGFFGGYLVLSELGRPLEFHCSTPIQPNQAQKILYGATLRSYVLGELIGQTLVAKAQIPVHAVLTDQEDLMSLALIRPETLVCVENVPKAMAPETTDPQTTDPQVTNPQVTNPEVTNELSPEGISEQPLTNVPELVLGTRRLWGTSTCSWQPEMLRSALSPLIAHVDLCEPFERIREAIREAQRVSTPPGDESHESAAA